MTQRSLAGQIGVVRETLAAYESGRYELGVETLQRLAETLETTVAYLIGETENPHPPPTEADELLRRVVIEGDMSALDEVLGDSAYATLRDLARLERKLDAVMALLEERLPRA